MAAAGSREKGLLASLRGLVRTLIEISQTRLALLASDLEEQGACFARMALSAVLGAVCLLCALILAVVFVIVASGEYRLIAIGGMFAVFSAVGIGSLLMLRRQLAERPKLLAATLAELQKDKNALSDSNEISR